MHLMATKQPVRSRMTAQSKVNIEAATDAKFNPASGGYQVQLTRKNGTGFVMNAAGPITYSSMSTAKSAVKKHNSALNPALVPTI